MTEPQPAPASVEDLRRRIDAIDGRIVDLLADRNALAREIARLKREAGQPPFDPAREREILERVGTLNRGRYPAAILEAVFREIVSAAREQAAD